MRTRGQVVEKIAYYNEQYDLCLKEEKWTAAAIFRAQVQTLEWALTA